MKWLAIAVAVAASTFPATVRAGPLTYTIEAGARLTQFSDYDTRSFTGSDEVVATLPSVANSVTSPGGNTSASASATPQALTASFSTQNGGIGRPGGIARFQNVGLIFRDNAAFRNLFGATATRYEVLLNFDFAFTQTTNSNFGIFAQAFTSESVNIAVSTPGDFAIANGSVSVTHGPMPEDVVSATGVLAGLTQRSEQKRISLPIDVSLNSPIITWNGQIDANGLALSGGFANGTASLTLPELPFLVTALDGTPLSNLGVQFDLIPRTAQGPGPDPGPNPDPSPTPVPEPASIALLATGLVGLGLALRRGRKAVAA